MQHTLWRAAESACYARDERETEAFLNKSVNLKQIQQWLLEQAFHLMDLQETLLRWQWGCHMPAGPRRDNWGNWKFRCFSSEFVCSAHYMRPTITITPTEKISQHWHYKRPETLRIAKHSLWGGEWISASLKWLFSDTESSEDEEKSGYMAPVVKSIGRRWIFLLRSLSSGFLKGILYLESLYSSFWPPLYNFITLLYGILDLPIFTNINETLNNWPVNRFSLCHYKLASKSSIKNVFVCRKAYKRDNV